MDKVFEKYFQQDQQGFFNPQDNDLESPFSGTFFNNSSHPIVGEYDWLEDSVSRTLKIKVNQIKDQPLDIKIENQMIRFKGKVENLTESDKKKSRSVVMFERSFSLPQDIDTSNPEFVNKEGEILIKFRRLNDGEKNSLKNPLKKSNTQTSQPNIPKQLEQERLPLSPQTDDLSL